jgi:hypothetical protein
VTAINDGIYPTSSNDSQDLRWGTWPEQGEQWIELDWNQPVTTNGSSVYFLDDGGGVRLPASWKIQYWNGSAFVDVTNPSAYPAADDTFNSVTFDSVTTTRLRAVLESGQGSVGVIQWTVPSVPGGRQRRSLSQARRQLRSVRTTGRRLTRTPPRLVPGRRQGSS